MDVYFETLAKIIPFFVGYLFNQYQERKKQKSSKIATQQYAAKTSFYASILQFKKQNRIAYFVKKIFKETKAIRFLILIGVNGKEAMMHVSVLFADRNDGITLDPKKIYINLETDTQYKAMLKRVEANSEEEIDVFEMPRGKLKSIYYKEQISHSLIKFIGRTPIDENNDAFVFASISTNTEEPFTSWDKMHINKNFDKIKKLIMS